MWFELRVFCFPVGCLPKGPDVPRESRAHPLTLLAWVIVGLHVLGLAFAALGISPGTPLVPLPDRLKYLAGAPAGWTLGWGCFMLCALSLVAFLAAVSHRLGAAAGLARLGVVVAVAAAAFDLSCDAVYIVVFPMIASWQPPPEQLFLAVERLTGVGSLVIANGGYSVAILLVSADLHGRKGVGPVTTWLGYAVAASGFLLAAAGFTGVPWHAEWATPPTLGLFCVWVVLVARSLAAGGSAA